MAFPLNEADEKICRAGILSRPISKTNNESDPILIYPLSAPGPLP